MGKAGWDVTKVMSSVFAGIDHGFIYADLKDGRGRPVRRVTVFSHSAESGSAQQMGADSCICTWNEKLSID